MSRLLYPLMSQNCHCITYITEISKILLISILENGVFDNTFGHCMCKDGFEGANCEINICSGHGHREYDQSCACNLYWHGSNCDQLGCIHGGWRNYARDKCKCYDALFTGTHCEFYIWQLYMSNVYFIILAIALPSIVCCVVYALKIMCPRLKCLSEECSLRIQTAGPQQKEQNRRIITSRKLNV